MSQPLPYWHPAKRILFRITGLYFILYFVTNHERWFWLPVTTFLNEQLGGTSEIIVEHNGSGDSIFFYIQALAMLLLSVIVGLIWGILDRKRRSYNQALYWIWTIVRYWTAYYLIMYGFGKIFLSQFPLPYLRRLVQPYGASSPMGLAWTFIGSSPRFSIFTGVAEALSGLLLLFRPTVKAGAMLGVSVLIVIVAMNFSYDIPVKLFSTHLLLAMLFILLPEAKRITTFLFTRKTVAPSDMYMPVFVKLGPRLVRTSLKSIAILWLIVMIIQFQGRGGSYAENKKKIPLYGIYTVAYVLQNNDTIPMNPNDNEQWRRLVIEFEERAAVQHFNDSFSKYEMRIDTLKQGITMIDEKKNKTYFWYEAEGKHMVFKQGVDDDTTTIIMHRQDAEDFLLINRGFHWINERPYNR